MNCLFKSFIIISIFSGLESNAQNLVPNPSFEDYDTCPTGPGQIEHAITWIIGQYLSTPDYFNSCNLGQVGVPYNFHGYQYARTGNAYAFVETDLIELINPSFDDHREYIQVKLNHELKSGIKYCLEFFVSPSDSDNYISNDIGAYFSRNQISDTSQYPSSPLSYIPQVENNANLNDRDRWIKVSGEFVAVGGEEYIIIGNFKDHNSTTSTYTGWADHNILHSDSEAGLYIDDVNLFICEKDSVIQMPNIFTPNADGLNDLFAPIEMGSVDEARLKIFNRWGQQIFMTDNIYEGWNGENFSDGVYYWELSYENLSGRENKSAGYVVLMR